MKISSAPFKGMMDYLPWECELRTKIERSIVDTYLAAGFQRIDTPAVEAIERLEKSEGGENLNLIYKVMKRGEKLTRMLDGSRPVAELGESDLADGGLRYDLTMPLSRFYANNQSQLRVPFKVIQMGRVYRAERQQVGKGRLREFVQCDIDIIGDETAAAEVELIHTTAKALLNLGFEGFTIRICDRRLLTGRILAAGFAPEQVGAVAIVLDKMDKIGADGVRSALAEIDALGADSDGLVEGMAAEQGVPATSDDPATQAVIDDLNMTIEAVEQLAAGRYTIEYDPTLVRGMGYYTGMVFEIAIAEFGSSVGGGGRYDKMIGQFLGTDVPAVGFSIGFERIFSIMAAHREEAGTTEPTKAMLLYGNESLAEVLAKSDELRAEGEYASVAIERKKKKLGKQIFQLKEAGYQPLELMEDGSIRVLD